MRSILGTFQSLLTLLFLAFVLSACGGGGSGSQSVTVESTEDISLAIDPDNLNLALNQSATIKAIATLVRTGTTADVSDQVNWSSDNIAIASITRSGGTVTVTPQSEGSTTIRAELDGYSATASVAVGPSLTKLTTSPASANIDDGSLFQLTATGTFSDGTSRDMTQDVLWTSSDEIVAIVSNEPDTAGEVSALEPGPVTISAKAGQVFANSVINIAPAPGAPDRLVLAVSPNVILNNGTEFASVEASVFANDDEAVINGTEVLFTSSSDTVILTPQKDGTISGIAASEVQSNSTGTFELSAEVTGTTARANAPLRVVSGLPEIFEVTGFQKVTNIGGEIRTGSEFAVEITNPSNRVFSIGQAYLLNGTDELATGLPDESVDPDDGLLTEGESSLFGYILESNQQDNGFRIIFSLTDQRTGTSFEVEYPFILE